MRAELLSPWIAVLFSSSIKCLYCTCTPNRLLCGLWWQNLSRKILCTHERYSACIKLLLFDLRLLISTNWNPGQSRILGTAGIPSQAPLAAYSPLPHLLPLPAIHPYSLYHGSHGAEPAGRAAPLGPLKAELKYRLQGSSARGGRSLGMYLEGRKPAGHYKYSRASE